MMITSTWIAITRKDTHPNRIISVITSNLAKITTTKETTTEDQTSSLKIKNGNNLKIKENRINITNRKIIIEITGDELNINVNADFIKL